MGIRSGLAVALCVSVALIGTASANAANPTTVSAFGNFATAAARRYGPTGSFWAGCGCAPHPIKVWEVWNEENIAPFWNPPNPGQYGALLAVVRAKLRAVDPGARILMGGLAYPSSLSATKMDANAFLQQTIAAAGTNSFDAVAVHVYASDANRAVNTLVAGTVNTLKTYAGSSAGAPRQQVWLNEFARPTSLDDPATATDELAASEATQRAWLDQLLSLLLP